MADSDRRWEIMQKLIDAKVKADSCDPNGWEVCGAVLKPTRDEYLRDYLVEIRDILEDVLANDWWLDILPYDADMRWEKAKKQKEGGGK